MAFLECDLEQVIMSASSKQLSERGLHGLSDKKRNQVRIGNYGICDIVAIARPNFIPQEHQLPYGNIYAGRPIKIQIVELKQNEIGFETLHQAVRYAKGIKNYFDDYDFFLCHSFVFEFILIGKTINTKSDAPYLVDVFDNIRMYTYRYGFDGIYFSEVYGYSLKDEGF